MVREYLEGLKRKAIMGISAIVLSAGLSCGTTRAISYTPKTDSSVFIIAKGYGRSAAQYHVESAIEKILKNECPSSRTGFDYETRVASCWDDVCEDWDTETDEDVNCSPSLTNPERDVCRTTKETTTRCVEYAPKERWNLSLSEVNDVLRVSGQVYEDVFNRIAYGDRIHIRMKDGTTKGPNFKIMDWGSSVMPESIRTFADLLKTYARLGTRELKENPQK